MKAGIQTKQKITRKNNEYFFKLDLIVLLSKLILFPVYNY